MRTLAVVILLTVAASPAAADKLGLATDVTLGGARHTGEIADHASTSSFHVRGGAGVMRGPSAILLSFTTGRLSDLVEPGNTYRPGFTELGVEPSVRREVTRGGGLRVHVRAGYRWRWLLTSTSLQRTCDLNGGCDGGYYTEAPTYRAHGPVAAIGVGYRTPGDVWAGFGVELAATRTTVERPGMNPDLGDTVISLGLNVAMGRGARQ